MAGILEGMESAITRPFIDPSEFTMINDTDWVEDVRRWYLKGAASTAASGADPGVTDYGLELGYEAAQPALQARHWPDAIAALTTDR